MSDDEGEVRTTSEGGEVAEARESGRYDELASMPVVSEAKSQEENLKPLRLHSFRTTFALSAD